MILTMSRNPFPSAEETINHPAYPGAVWNLEPHKKGLLPCAKDRGGPVNISWEVHGDGPRKIIVRRPSPYHLVSPLCPC